MRRATWTGMVAAMVVLGPVWTVSAGAAREGGGST